MPAWISDIIAIAPWLGAIIAFIFAVSWLWNKVSPTLRRWGRILDRLTGVPADPGTGQPEVLGIFERMDRTDRMMKEQSAVLEDQNGVLETIRHEVEFNNGSSVKDAVVRVEQKLEEHLAFKQPSTTVNVIPGGLS